MDPSSQTHSTTTSTQPALRKSKSVGTLRSKPRRITSLIRRFFSECSSALTKLKSLSDIALAEDDEVDAFFESSDSDYLPRRQGSGSLKQIELQFLSDYRSYKSLEGISKHYLNLDPKIIMDTGETLGKIPYKNLDISKVREKLESSERTMFTSDISTDDSDSSKDKKQNVGEMLWNYRRSLWLESNSDAEDRNVTHESLKNIPKSFYPTIYSNLIEKSKPLKEGKRINLQDLLEVINEGWIQEQRWERAAKGLA